MRESVSVRDFDDEVVFVVEGVHDGVDVDDSVSVCDFDSDMLGEADWVRVDEGVAEDDLVGV